MTLPTMESLSASHSSSPLSSVPTSPLLDPPSSPLSSLLSRTPSPPPGGWRLFSPPPSQDADEDMPRPRKRRKIEPKVRTTKYLDLTSDTAQSDYDRRDAEEELVKALRNRRKIVIVAGAGISVSAGIPDFRSSHGLFKSLRNDHKLKSSGKQLFDASVYKDDSSTSHFHDMVRKLSRMSKKAKPTVFHNLIAQLATEGRLLRLYTQNVDGLETQIPSLSTLVPLPHKGPWPQTVQLHGGLEKMTCQKCMHIADFDATLFEGPVPPACPQCKTLDDLRTNDFGKRSHGVGKLRPRIVLYNEHNPDDEAIGAVSTADMRTRPDAVVVVGTSMKIPGVRRIVSEMCKIVRGRREGTTIWINRDSVPPGKDLEDCWDLVVRGDSDDVAKLTNLKQLDGPNSESDSDGTQNLDDTTPPTVFRNGEFTIRVPPSPFKEKPTASSHIDKFKISLMTPPRSQDGDGPSFLNSKRDFQLSPSKTKLKPEEVKEDVAFELERQTSSRKVQNPASKGKKLKSVLQSGPSGKKSSLSKTSHVGKVGLKKKEILGGGNQPKIMLNFKVRKDINTVQVTMPVPTKALPPSLSSDLETYVLPRKEDSGFDEVSSHESSPAPVTPTLPQNAIGSYERRETISPKGHVPLDMMRLLN